MSSTGLPSRLAAALAYAGWWITGLVFWVLEREDRFVRFHAAQAVTAFGLLAVLLVALAAGALVSLTFHPHAFTLFAWAAGIGAVMALVLWAIAVGQAARGVEWHIPLVGRLAERMAGTPNPELRTWNPES
jgi:uncharacterized membrane protein